MTTGYFAAKRACEAYYFHARLGAEVIDDDLFSAVRDNDRPAVWDLNRVFEVTASTDDEIDGVLATAARLYQRQGYNYFSVSPFTAPGFTARLALEDYAELTPVVQMVLSGAVDVQQPAGFAMSPVTSQNDWDELFRLVRADHIEGGRTQGAKLDEDVTAGMVDGYRRRAGPCQFFIAYINDDICGYGSATSCPNGMGMVEDLFTSPPFRRRGVASSLIAGCVEYMRQHGARDFLIGSLTSESPKHLYRKLGFQSVCLTRSFHKKLTTQPLLLRRKAPC